MAWRSRSHRGKGTHGGMRWTLGMRLGVGETLWICDFRVSGFSRVLGCFWSRPVACLGFRFRPRGTGFKA